MFQRMCFHDNSINVDLATPFAEYMANNIVNVGSGPAWKGPNRYLDTSGSDASVLICPEERYHPNNNYDKTASRVLGACQDERFFDGDYSLMSKYGFSYADCLHNGGIAATIYLTGKVPEVVLQENSFVFGRLDACYAQGNVKKPLCGPTELLPSLSMTAEELNSWFTYRGMSECQFLSMLWTHTTMDNMGFQCPLRKLPCTVESEKEVDLFKWNHALGHRYFDWKDKLDYFRHFIDNGIHAPHPLPMEDPEAGNCNWTVAGEPTHWPLTRADCTIATGNADNNVTNLTEAIEDFRSIDMSSYLPEILLCTFRMMSGDGGGVEGGACNFTALANMDQCTTPREPFKYLFGGFFQDDIGPPCALLTRKRKCRAHAKCTWDQNKKCISIEEKLNLFTGNIRGDVVEEKTDSSHAISKVSALWALVPTLMLLGQLLL